MSDSIFDQIGGAAAVDAAVDIFYRKVLSDDSISMFFDDTDMDAQRDKQRSFLTMVFGGPNEYTGKDLRTAHAPLVEKGLNEDHFMAVAGHLQATLEELNVPANLIETIMGIAAGTIDDVLNRQYGHRQTLTAVSYNGVKYKARVDESVLDVLLRHGIDIPYSCKAGVCNTCIMLREDGGLPSVATQGLKDTLVEQGCFLACQCIPSGPITVRKSDYIALFTKAIVVDKKILSADVCRVRLKPSTELNYHAGQYINLRVQNGQIRSYSLASLPAHDDFIELHIKRMKNGQVSNWLFDIAKVNDELDIQGPFGDCYYLSKSLDDTLLMIATGTGLAPLYGILRDALNSGHKGKIKLYHGDRTPDALYLDSILKDLSSTQNNFTYIPCVTNTIKGLDDSILNGRASDYALSQNANLIDTSIYLCGSPAMVAVARKQAYLNGADIKRIYADPFITKDLRMGKIRNN